MSVIFIKIPNSHISDCHMRIFVYIFIICDYFFLIVNTITQSRKIFNKFTMKSSYSYTDFSLAKEDSNSVGINNNKYEIVTLGLLNNVSCFFESKWSITNVNFFIIKIKSLDEVPNFVKALNALLKLQ